MNRCIHAAVLGSTFAMFGCCDAPPARPIQRRAPATAPVTAFVTPATQPNMLHEAPMPLGYPAPGPIGVVMIKHYPPSRAVISRKAGATQDALFEPLFDHISKHNIPMSTPVLLTFSGDPTTRPAEQSMAFFYGNPATGTLGADKSVVVEDVPAVTVVSIALRGSYDADHFQTGLKSLQAWLTTDAGKAYKPAGPPRYLAYNSPFVPSFVRYGEVQLPVTAK